MSISVSCTNCNATHRVKSEYSGRKAKCPACQAVMQIPLLAERVEPKISTAVPQPSPVGAAQRSVVAEPKRALPPTAAKAPVATAPTANKSSLKPAAVQRSASEASEPPPLTAAQIVAAFQGPIEPVKSSAAYSFGLLLVLIAMVVLTAAYVLLIGLVCYGMYYHAVNHTGLLHATGSVRGQVAAIGMYLSVFFIGGLTVLFMVKPIFARPAKQSEPRSLYPTEEPLLFAFVAKICDAVGSAHPSRIDVDLQVNASASFRRGWISMLGNDLVLTIGLPLVAGFNLRQFAGVLAHEFGHFSQGAGMRLTYCIRSISFWYTRVVYERDEWDERLVRWTRGLDIRLAIFIYAARLMIWLTRKVLYVLMIAGHAVSGFMLRQMEFDADLHEARLAGSDTFESTARRLAVLGIATNGAYSDLGEFYRDGRLGDDLPRLIMANVSQLPAELTERLNEQFESGKTGWLDTHPCDKDRVAAAHRDAATGIFRLEAPATVLFTNFAGLSRSVTVGYYKQIFGQQFKPSDMRSVDELLRRQIKEQDSQKALWRYFQGIFTTLRPLKLASGWLDKPADPAANLQRIRAGRQALVDGAREYGTAFGQFLKADSQIQQSYQALALLDASFKIKANMFPVRMTTSAQAREAREDAQRQQTRSSRTLDALDQTAATRLIAALELLYVPKVADRIEDSAAVRDEARELVSALTAIDRQLPALLTFRNQHAALSLLLENLQGNEANNSLIETIKSHMKQATTALRDFSTALAAIEFPFDHGHGKMSIAKYAVPELPGQDDLGAIYDASAKLLEMLPSLYVRVAGRLAAIAEQVETALKLPPLPEPNYTDPSPAAT